MSKFLKMLLLIIGIIIIVIIGGYIAIKTYLSPNNVRTIATKIASESLARPVEIGKVGLKFGFKVGITIDDVSIANSKGFSSGPMVQIQKTTLNLKLLPLLRRQIVIGGLDFSGLKVKIERNRQGNLNFTALIPKEMEGSNWSLSLSSLNISDGDIHYTDSKEKMEIRMKDLKQSFNFKGSKISTNGKSTTYVLKSKTIPEMVLKISNDVEYDALKKNIQVKKITVAYDPIILNVTGSVEKMERLILRADLRVGDISKLKALIPADSRPAKLNGALKANFSILGTMKNPKLDGSCELKNITVIPKGMVRGFEKVNGTLSFDENAIRNIIVHGAIGNTTINITGSIANLKAPVHNITAKIDGDLRDLEALTTEMQGVAMKGAIHANVTMKGKTENLSYSGNYTVKNAHIDGIGLAKPITNLQAKGTFQHNGARIKSCSGNIGRTDFSFSGTVSNFKKPILLFNNKSNTVDLDELIPKSKKGKNTGKKGAPVTLIGDVQINSLTGMDMVYKNVVTKFTYENGIIDLKNCTANAFDGKVKFDFYYNSNNPEPYRITTRMTSVSAKKILKRFLKFENLEGKLTGMSNFKGNGFSQKQVISNLTASGNLRLNNGSFKNFKFLTGLLAWLGMKDFKNVAVNDLVIYFKITNGKANIKDWALSSSIGNFLMNGTIGLKGSLNLNITTTLSKKYSNIVKKYHGDWIFPIDNKGRATIDIIATGKLTSPKFKLDKSKIKKRIKGKIKNEFDRKKKEWEKKLKDIFKWK